MPFVASLALLSCLAQDKVAAFGKTNAQILAMGRKRWFDYCMGQDGGGSTAGMTSAEGLYGDALAWRNDRVGKGRIGRLRQLLQDTRNDAIAVGEAVSGGGTMWHVLGAGLYADGEQTLYTVLTLTGKPKKHVVSDVEKAYAHLRREFAKADSEPDLMNEGRLALPRLRRDLDGVIAEAARRPRKASDALLDFCVKAMTAG